MVTTSMAPSAARIPHLIAAPSNAGPAGAAVASSHSRLPRTISQLVPMSMNRRTRASRSIPLASRPAVMSPPTYAPKEGNTTARARGCTMPDRPRSVASTSGNSRAAMMNGAMPSGSGSMPSTRWVMVALPASATSYTSSGSTPPAAHAARASSPRVSVASCWSLSRAPGSIMVALILVITSAPNGCCLFSMDSTATGVPVDRSSSVATTVVVPRSKAMPNRRAVVSPGSTAISTSSTTTAVTL